MGRCRRTRRPRYLRNLRKYLPKLRTLQAEILLQTVEVSHPITGCDRVPLVAAGGRCRRKIWGKCRRKVWGVVPLRNAKGAV